MLFQRKRGRRVIEVFTMNTSNATQRVNQFHLGVTVYHPVAFRRCNMFLRSASIVATLATALSSCASVTESKGQFPDRSFFALYNERCDCPDQNKSRVSTSYPDAASATADWLNAEMRP
jgi:hypothetical protein